MHLNKYVTIIKSFFNENKMLILNIKYNLCNRAKFNKYIVCL